MRYVLTLLLTLAEYDGHRITCDLPSTEHRPNGLGTDGRGLCVFASLDMAARWKNIKPLIGFRDYMTNEPGVGWPAKVSQYVPKISGERGQLLMEGVDWGQAITKDPGILDKIVNGRGIACITYGYSPRYGHDILHMVCLVSLDSEYGVVLDCNYPGSYEWVERAELIRRWTMAGGWVIWLNGPPPPPIPVNQ